MKNVKNKHALFLSILMIFSFIIAGCQQNPTPTTVSVIEPTQILEPQNKGGTIIIGLSDAPVSLDPADHRSRQSETVLRNMFDALVTRDSRSGVHLQLAESLKWNDEKTLEIKLKEGVKFHDNSTMTAEDVVFTFERIIKPDQIEYPEVHSSPRAGLIAPLESIEKVDDLTVLMHFSYPWPVAEQMLVHQQIVPKAYFAKVGTEGFIAHPIGTGPFKFVSSTSGFNDVVMERFDDYYGGATELSPVGNACTDKVIFRVIPEASTRAAAILAGEVQIIQAVPNDLVNRLEADPSITVKTAPGTQPKWLELNVNKAPFNEIKVRQALNYAIDKNLLISEIYDGRAIELAGPLSPYNSYADQELQPYAYDLDKAKSLLAEAGWADTNDDGLVDKDQQPLSFVIDTLEEHRNLAEAIASLYQQAGIDASVRFWEFSVISPMLQNGERMAYLDDWGDSAFDPIGHFEAKWHSFIENQPYGRGNFSGFGNERVDELIKLGEQTIEVEKRKDIYNEAQSLIYEEAPAVFLILPEEIEAASTKITNWEPASDSRLNMHDVCIIQ